MSLSDEGYQPIAASNGLAALNVLNYHCPDLILLDMWMPGMDGKTFLHHYRQLPIAQVPVIVMTAYDPIVQDKELLRSVAAYILKPFDLNAMHLCIKNNLPSAT